MKLTDIKNHAMLSEGRVDANVLLSIDNLIASQGTRVNTFQLLMIARITAALKLGYFYKETNPWESLHSVSKELMDTLRALPPQELLNLAIRLRSLLDIKDKDELYTYANPTQELTSWIKFVASREAND